MMRVIDCHGTAAERGAAHGESLRAEIAEAISRWEEATIRGLGTRAPRDIDSYCEDMLSRTGLLDRARALTPALAEEVAAIARAAGQPEARIAAYNMMDEQWWYDSPTDAPPPGCSLIGIPVRDGHVLAQNMDLPAHMEGAQVVLRLSGPDLPAMAVLSAAGMIGLTGVNATGLAVAVNTLLMLRHDADGLPVAFAMRHALAAESAGSARDRLAAVPHASGQHYALATRDALLSVECSVGGCAPLDVPAEGLLHTNHPLASKDVDAGAQAHLDRSGFNDSSRARLDWLRGRSMPRNATDVQALFDLPDAPICMRAETHGGSFTFASVLYEVTDRVTARFAGGVPGGRAWQDVAVTA
jgi:isopenicillin-N N-acyltransferase like protein